MVESIMYFGIGILLAAASVLVVVARVRGRSVRLTAHQLESAIPSSTVENQEQNDIPRAAFPGSIRALEVKVEQLQGENDSHLAELRKKDDAVNRLQIELSALRQQLCTTEKELALKTTAMQESERALSERESKLAKLMAELAERSALVDAQSVEIIALKTQVDAKATAMREAERVLSDKESHLAELTTGLEERSALVNAQNTEIIALKAQIDAKATVIRESERVLSEKESQLAKLMADLEERSGFEFAQEIAIIALKTQVQARATAKQEVENALSDTESKLAKLIGELDDRSAVADTQQIEIATLRNQVEVLKEQLDGVSNELKAVEGSRDAERADLKAATEELTQERSKFYNFQSRVADLVQQIVLQTTEEHRAQEDLENRLADQTREFNEREFEIEQLRSDIEIAHKSEADLRIAIDDLNARDNTAIQNLEAEMEKLRAALDRCNGERMRLSYELSNAKRQGNSAA